MRYRVLIITAALAGAVLSLSPARAPAATLEGVTFPDTATVGGQTIKLNGLGLRKAFIIAKVYVAALYLQTPTHDGTVATKTDEPKRIAMQFLRDVDHTDMIQAFNEGFAHTATPALQPQVEQFRGFFTQPILTGQQYIFDYVPGQGTTVQVAGKTMGTIPGADFMRALWGIWLGDNPPTESVKDGMLGNT